MQRMIESVFSPQLPSNPLPGKNLTKDSANWVCHLNKRNLKQHHTQPIGRNKTKRNPYDDRKSFQDAQASTFVDRQTQEWRRSYENALKTGLTKKEAESRADRLTSERLADRLRVKELLGSAPPK